MAENAAREMYLARFDRHRQRAIALDIASTPLLTAKERSWIEAARETLLCSTDNDEMRKITIAMHALLGKLVVIRNEEGMTFRQIGKVVELTPERIRQYGLRYQFMLRAVEAVGLRDLPWHELK
jgi:DNA-directed RNA polymerase sigma subunit (sigma70/sigma32)